MYPSKSEPKSRVFKNKKKKGNEPIVVQVHAHPNFSPIKPAQLISRDELQSEENIYLTNDSRNIKPATTVEFDAHFKSRAANDTLSP